MPFETIDQFGRGMIDHLHETKPDLILSHMLHRREDDNDIWQESFLRLQDTQSAGYIDIREYYWAHLTENKVSINDIQRWLGNALKGARRLCEENQELRDRFQKKGRLFKWKIHRLRWLLFIFKFIPQWRFMQAIFGGLADFIAAYVGDIAIYTTTDLKSKHYFIRQQILRGALQSINHLLDQDYDQIVICGHSLGSVIAYDAINKLNARAHLAPELCKSLHKLAGFVSFGSPLDKIAFFFREHVQEQQSIRRQIIDQLFSFRAYRLRPERRYPIIAPLMPQLDHIHWVNYHCAKDPISDRLVFSKMHDDDNVELELESSWGRAHVAYWHSKVFYTDICRRFLQGSPPKSSVLNIESITSPISP